MSEIQPVILLSPPQDEPTESKKSFLRRKLSSLSLRKEVLLQPESFASASSSDTTPSYSNLPTPSYSADRAKPSIVLQDKYRDYKKGKKIGTGATAKLRLLEPRDKGKLVAMKIYRKKDKDETEKEYDKRLTSEFCISKTLSHPHIVHVYDLLQDKKGRWCTIMEYVSKHISVYVFIFWLVCRWRFAIYFTSI